MPKTKEQFDYLVEKIAATATTQFWIGVQYVKEENKVKGKHLLEVVVVVVFVVLLLVSRSHTLELEIGLAGASSTAL